MGSSIQLSGLRSLITNSPLTSTGGNSPTVGITEAGSGTDGYLSSSNFTIFSNKLSPSLLAAPNGIATLDGGGKVLASQLPSTIMNYHGTYDILTNTPALSDGMAGADPGDVYICNTAGTRTFGPGNTITVALGDWLIYSQGLIWEKSDNSDAVVSVNGLTGVVVLTKTSIGLSNVPNVDATNPVNIVQNSSYRFVTDAEKSTWNSKQGAITLTTTGTSGAATFIGNTLNIPNYAGTITGTGTIDRVTKWTGTTSIGDGTLYDNGTQISNTSSYVTDTVLSISSGLSNANGINVFATGSGIVAASILDNYTAIAGYATQGIGVLGSSVGPGTGFGFNNTGVKGVAVQTELPAMGTQIGGRFEASGGASNYAVVLQDGTQAAGKFLKSVTSGGAANWANITAADVSGVTSGSGTPNRHSKWITATTLGDSLIEDDGTTLAIGTTPSSTIQFLIASTKSRGLTANGSSIGVYGAVNTSFSATGNFYGVYGISDGITGNFTTRNTYGTYGKAQCGVGAYGYSSGGLAPNIGVQGEALSFAFETPAPLALGGKFSASGGYVNYAVQLIDGTEGAGKFLKSITSDGMANWATLSIADIGLSLTTTGSSGSSTLVGNTLNIPTYTAAGLGAVETSRQLTINGTSYDLSADRSWSVGTVTSISNFTITFNGTSVTTGVSDPFVAPSLNINIPIANSFVSRGLLSGSDWSIFNGKQNAITFTTTGISGSASFSSNILNIPQYVGRSAGTGTVDRVPVWATASTLKDGTLYDNGSTVAVGGSPVSSAKLYIYDDSSVTYGIAVNAAKTGGGGLGVDSASYGTGAATNTGLRGSASNSTSLNLGVSGIATAATAGTNIGLYGSASAGSSNYAIQLQDGTENVVGRFLKNMTTDGKANWATLTAADVSGVQGTITLTTTGTSGAATLVGNTLNIPEYAGGSGSVPQSIINSSLIFYANNC